MGRKTWLAKIGAAALTLFAGGAASAKQESSRTDLLAWQNGVAKYYREQLYTVWTNMPPLSDGFDAIDCTRRLQAKYAPSMKAEAASETLLLEHANAKIVRLATEAESGVERSFAAWCAEPVKRPLFYSASGFEGTGAADFPAATNFLFSTVLDNNGKSAIKGFDHSVDFDGVSVKSGFMGRPHPSPFQRGWFFFVDDRPGANWGHDCRYVFLDEDLSAFAVVYESEPPDISDAEGHAELVPLDSPRKGEAIGENSFSAFRNSLYASNAAMAQNALRYSGQKANTYAVLISGGADKENNYSRYWGDVAMVYSTLRLKYGVPRDNIHVLMASGGGTDADMRVIRDSSGNIYATAHYEKSPLDLDGDGIADYSCAATKDQIKAAFGYLAGKLTKNDQLLVFVTDHGFMSDDGTCYLVAWGTGANHYISSSEFASYVKGIKAPTAFALEFCYSGAFADSLVAQGNRVVLTACGKEPSSAWYISPSESSSDGDPIVAAHNYSNPWAWAFNAAIRGSESMWGWTPWKDEARGLIGNADSNGDRSVSMYEAAQAANDFVKSYGKVVDNVKWTFCDSPQYKESTAGLGKRLEVLRQSDTPYVDPRWSVSTLCVTIPQGGGSGSITITCQPSYWKNPDPKYVYTTFSPQSFDMTSGLSSWSGLNTGIVPATGSSTLHDNVQSERKHGRPENGVPDARVP